MLLIIYPLSDFHNSKWQIQPSVRENEKKNDTIGKNMYSEVFGVADNESIVRFPEFEMACSFSVDLFVSNVWCRVFCVDFSACRLFCVDFSACRVFRVDFSPCRVFRVDFSACRVFNVEFSPCTAD